MPVGQKIIKEAAEHLIIPLLIGGGIKTKHQLETVYKAGADLVVIGNAFENDVVFLNELKKQ